MGVDQLMGDLRHATRMLLKTPTFTVVAVLTLALGIGANTAMFSVVDGVLLRGLPFPEPDRVMLLTEVGRQSGDRISTSWQNFQDWRDQNSVFEHLGVYRGGSMNLTSGDRPERLPGAQMSSAAFRALGLEPIVGRTFMPAEDKPGAPRTVILSEGLWRRRFGLAPATLGSQLTLDGESYTVIGIMPADLKFPSSLTEIWVPIGPFVDGMPVDRGNHPGLYVIGRLKPGVTVQQARAAMSALADRMSAEHPENRTQTIWMAPLPDDLVADVKPALLVLIGAVGFVLLVACANLANLMLARADNRQRELAVRAALGAGRGRIVRQLLTESLLLASIGGALGVLLAWGAVTAMVRFGPQSIPRLDQVSLDYRALGFTLLVSIATGVLFGLAPALRVSSPDLQTTLREAGRGVRGSRHRMRGFLVVSEVALAVMLLVGAGLTVRSLQKLLTIDPGFTAEQAVSMRITLPDASYPDEQRWAQFYRELLARVTPLAGFDAVGLNSLLPLTENSSESPVIAEGKPLPSPEEPGRMCLFQTASGGYFKAMGITVLSGRTFDDRDRAETTKVVLVDETLARAMWPGENAVGKRLAFEFDGHFPENVIPKWREVVGVVRHVKHYGLTRDSFVQIYAPIEQPPFWNEGRRPSMALVVRSRLPPASVVSLVRQEVAALDAQLPVYDVRTMPEYIARQVEQPRFSMVLLSVFGGLALVLAIVGIYGVLSYSVSQRTQEIGIRMAIGARASDVLLLVLRQGVGMALVGLAVGVAGALAVRQVLQSILVGVSPTDPLTFGSVIGIIVVASCVAAYLPARRATRVDPIEVLRAE